MADTSSLALLNSDDFPKTRSSTVAQRITAAMNTVEPKFRGLSLVPGLLCRQVSENSYTLSILYSIVSRDSSVGIATDNGLDGPGIESRCGRDFPAIQTCRGAHTASCTMGTGSFPGVNCGRGVTLTPHPLLAPRPWKSRAIPLRPLWAITGPVTGLLYL